LRPQLNLSRSPYTFLQKFQDLASAEAQLCPISEHPAIAQKWFDLPLVAAAHAGGGLKRCGLQDVKTDQQNGGLIFVSTKKPAHCCNVFQPRPSSIGNLGLVRSVQTSNNLHSILNQYYVVIEVAPRLRKVRGPDKNVSPPIDLQASTSLRPAKHPLLNRLMARSVRPDHPTLHNHTRLFPSLHILFPLARRPRSETSTFSQRTK